MSTSDIGEGLVGAYMRYIEGCPIVLYNSFLADQQGEVDVVAVKPSHPGSAREVFLCEVTMPSLGRLTGSIPTRTSVSNAVCRQKATSVSTCS